LPPIAVIIDQSTPATTIPELIEKYSGYESREWDRYIETEIGEMLMRTFFYIREDIDVIEI